jgi:hypothetical protein
MSATTLTPPISLEELLAYRHRGVVCRYAKDHHAAPAEAEEVFQQLLKWLYLCARAADGLEGFGCVVSPDIEKIDWMWHTFLLFTRDYADFCECYLGTFIHHVPNEDEDEDETPVDQDAYRTALERQFSFVYDVLGEETLTAWYDECRYAGPPM